MAHAGVCARVRVSGWVGVYACVRALLCVRPKHRSHAGLLTLQGSMLCPPAHTWLATEVLRMLLAGTTL